MVGTIAAAVGATVLEKLEASLSPDERSRADRFHFPHDRYRFIAGRGILRALLGAYLDRDPKDLVFRYGPQGKPSLETNEDDHSVSFNLSHKQGLAVYAFARGRRLGIDLESISTAFPGEEIATRFFSPRELEELLALPPEARAEGFFLAWTRKEAYIKALAGCGKILLSERFLPSLRHFVSLERLFAGIFRIVGAPRVRFRIVRRHYGPDSLRGNSSGHQVSHAHQIVGGAGEGKHPIDLQRSAMPHLA